MTVKKSIKRTRGRPPGDPEDIRTERIALRVHPDLLFELNVLSRYEGVTRSVLIERLLIRLVNDHFARTVIDKVGRYQNEPPDDRALGKGIEYLRQLERKVRKTTRQT
jgi:hypothetical protein